MTWDTIAAGFRACRALGWSPLPLSPQTKRPRLYSWPRCCIVPLSDDELRSHYQPGRELGVACGYGGLVIADVDRGAAAARKLLHELWGPPLAVVLGGRPDGFKAIYKGPWAEPAPELTAAARDYAAAGQALARATQAEAETVRAAHKRAKHRFDELQDAWIEAEGLIASADVSNDEIALQILSFGRQAVLPPSRHRDGVHTYRWEGTAP
jgi:hypothetical protein